MVMVSLDVLCAPLRDGAKEIAAALNCRVSSTLEEQLTYAPLCQTEEEAARKIWPTFCLLQLKYSGCMGATVLKASEENEPLFVVGCTESGLPRFLIMPATFGIQFGGVDSAVQGSGEVNSATLRYTSFVGVYRLSQRRW